MGNADFRRPAESSTNAELIRAAYGRYAAGDLSAVLELVDPDVVWTYLDPSEAEPEPRICHGRDELAHALHRQRTQGLLSELEETIEHDDRVVVVTRTPGLDVHRARKADDRNFDVFTFKAGRVVALRACRDRNEALVMAGIA